MKKNNSKKIVNNLSESNNLGLQNKIFQNNTNKITKYSILNTLQNGVGSIKILPSFAREWKNIIYLFNKNNLKNLPLDTVFINKIIKNYFDLFIVEHRKKRKTVYKKRKQYLNKIYISNVDIKHTNQKAKITLYTVNQEKEYLKNRYYITMKYLNKKIIKKYIQIYKIFLSKIKRILLVATHATHATHTDKNNVNFLTYNPLFELAANTTNTKTVSTSTLVRKKLSKSEYIKYKLGYLRIFITLNQLFLEKIWNNYTQNHYSNFVNILKKYDLLYSLNLLKFNKRKLLPKLSKILLKILSKSKSKKIEYNIVNLKSFRFNSDIFTSIATFFLKTKPLMNPIRLMGNLMGKLNYPKTNTIIERTIIDSGLKIDPFRNKYRDLRIISNLGLQQNNNSCVLYSATAAATAASQQSSAILRIKKNISKFINNLYKNPSDLITNNYNLFSTSNIYNSNLQNSRIKNVIFKSISYKNMSGLRMEIKGRLSKRFRADRARYYVKWKGGLKNIYSAYRGLSAVPFRGNSKPQVNQTIMKSTRRIGAFAVKGWIAGK